MYISQKDWKAYITKLRKLNETAANLVQNYIRVHGFANRDALIAYCYEVVEKYGTGSAALSAAMYDAVAEVSGQFVEAAQMAEVASYGDVAKTVNGVLKTSQNAEEMAGAVSRMVKKAGCDTTLRNAFRDRAQYAWIPSGDTCAFCLALAANGWVDISAKRARDGYEHAEHIHSNCDCTYAIRFSKDGGVDGYDPDEYYDQINKDLEEQGMPSLDDYKYTHDAMNSDVINAIRHQNYAENSAEINAQKRSAYEKRQELNSSKAEESKA